MRSAVSSETRATLGNVRGGDHAAKRSGGVERSETVSGGEQPTLGGRITKKRVTSKSYWTF